jgi:hypothetical protein
MGESGGQCKIGDAVEIHMVLEVLKWACTVGTRAVADHRESRRILVGY